MPGGGSSIVFARIKCLRNISAERSQLHLIESSRYEIVAREGRGSVIARGKHGRLIPSLDYGDPRADTVTFANASKIVRGRDKRFERW